mgnify:CR=1 FL=1
MENEELKGVKLKFIEDKSSKIDTPVITFNAGGVRGGESLNFRKATLTVMGLENDKSAFIKIAHNERDSTDKRLFLRIVEKGTKDALSLRINQSHAKVHITKLKNQFRFPNEGYCEWLLTESKLDGEKIYIGTPVEDPHPLGKSPAKDIGGKYNSESFKALKKMSDIQRAQWMEREEFVKAKDYPRPENGNYKDQVCIFYHTSDGFIRGRINYRRAGTLQVVDMDDILHSWNQDYVWIKVDK